MRDWHEGRCLVVGHRGARVERPENTLASFRRAAELGADAVELDVRRTRDDVLVVRHDANLAETCGQDIDLCEVDVAMVRDKDAGWGFTDPNGGHPFRGAGMRVPTLEEALDLAAEVGLRVNVEVKNLPHDPDFTPQPKVALAAAALIMEREETDRVWMSSFNLGDMVGVHEHYPEIGTAWLTLAGFSPLQALGRASHEGLDGLHPQMDAVAGDVAGALAAKAREDGGFWVMPWAIDDPSEMARLAGVGVSAICTDHPGIAAQAVSASDR